MKVKNNYTFTIDAYQWKGKNTDDFYNFIKDNGIDKTVVEAVYNKDNNSIILHYDTLYGGAVIHYNEYIVYDNGIEILSEKQFTEKYTEVKQ